MASLKASPFARFLANFARTVAVTYYHLTVAGEKVNATGPVLLVANHTNALLDPALVLAVTKRPVWMLAKSTLLKVPVLGALMRAGGCIPVYRRQDSAEQMGKNTEMFETVEAMLAKGEIVGLFPEGISHDKPSVTPLKTGAARIALGTLIRYGTQVPIVPVGLVFQDKAIFRSEAMVVTGPPVDWDDIAMDPAAESATRALTDRISASMRSVTVNLESWADRPLIECAEKLYDAETNEASGLVDHVRQQQIAVATLKRLRDTMDFRWEPLVERLRRHTRRLEWLGLSPRDLCAEPSPGAVARWTLRTVPILAALWFALLGIGVYWLPYRLTGVVAGHLSRERDTDATYKAIIGMVFMAGWTLLVSIAAATIGGWRAGVFTLLLLPLLGVASLTLAERWRHSQEDARRFLLLKRNRQRIVLLRNEQRNIAQELQAIVEEGVLKA